MYCNWWFHTQVWRIDCIVLWVSFSGLEDRLYGTLCFIFWFRGSTTLYFWVSFSSLEGQLYGTFVSFPGFRGSTELYFGFDFLD